MILYSSGIQRINILWCSAIFKVLEPSLPLSICNDAERKTSIGNHPMEVFSVRRADRTAINGIARSYRQSLVRAGYWGGDGGIRTLVQTWNQAAFYTFSSDRIFDARGGTEQPTPTLSLLSVVADERRIDNPSRYFSTTWSSHLGITGLGWCLAASNCSSEKAVNPKVYAARA